jgi:hypothetical protein
MIQLKRLFLYTVPLFVVFAGLLVSHFRFSALPFTASNIDDKMSSSNGYRSVSVRPLVFFAMYSLIVLFYYRLLTLLTGPFMEENIDLKTCPLINLLMCSTHLPILGRNLEKCE